MRRQKQFSTLECYTGLKTADIPEDSVVLLECMSNLTANEMYQEGGAGVRLLIVRMEEEDMHYPIHLGVTEAGECEEDVALIVADCVAEACVDDFPVEYAELFGNVCRSLRVGGVEAVEGYEGDAFLPSRSWTPCCRRSRTAARRATGLMPLSTGGMSCEKAFLLSCGL